MNLLHAAMSVLGVTPEEGVALVDNSAKTLERGGLYVVVIVLLVGFVSIFLIKEQQIKQHAAEKKEQIEQKDKQVKELHALIIQMVEKQTQVLTEANLNSRKIEGLLERLMNHLEHVLRDK